MTDSERDPAVRRAIEELRRLPAADPEAIQRVVTAAAAARLTPADDLVTVGAPSRRVRARWGVAAIAAAAAFAGFMLRGEWSATRAPVAAASSDAAVASTAAPVHAVASAGSDALPVPHQFVFRDPSGSVGRVSVVGDFNGWNPAAAPMTRSQDGLWSVTLPVLPGRHVYGFMVNDTLFKLDPDPRAPRARDPDLGVDGSVTIVGRP